MVDLQGSFKHYDKIFPFADRPDIFKEIVWWPVSEDTPVLPYANPFTLRAWDEREQLEEPTVGTRYGPYEKYFGPLPAVRFGGLCGSADLWLNGLSYDQYLAGEYGTCDCPVFMPAILDAEGGDVEDGLGELLAAATIDAEGGDVDDGVATFATAGEIVAEGGDVGDGVSELLATATIDALGGDVDDGVAGFPTGPTIDALGGDVDSGVATGVAEGQTAFLHPATGANVSAGFGHPWGSPGNVTACDGVPANASYAGAASGKTDFLTGTDYSPGLYAGSQVKGIELQVTKNATLGTGVEDAEVRLTLGGTVIGVDQSILGSWPLSPTVFTYGGSSNDWGLPLFAADVNDPTFGISFQASKSGPGIRQARVDCMEVKIYWVHFF